MTEALVDVRDLKKHFSMGSGFDLKAVDGVTFTIQKGETLGLVGESGCGKSTLGRTIIRLYENTAGEVLFKGQNVHQLRGKEVGQFNRDVQMIFQDPQASLNPRMTVEDIIAEGL
ncbi:ATP-binding cassette domain-containing protein, partial [Mesorhizobium sp. M00.F.Ca.ET.186.01.1.1]